LRTARSGKVRYNDVFPWSPDAKLRASRRRAVSRGGGACRAWRKEDVAMSRSAIDVHVKKNAERRRRCHDDWTPSADTNRTGPCRLERRPRFQIVRWRIGEAQAYPLNDHVSCGSCPKWRYPSSMLAPHIFPAMQPKNLSRKAAPKNNKIRLAERDGVRGARGKVFRGVPVQFGPLSQYPQ
jgi:hypothetical protein